MTIPAGANSVSYPLPLPITPGVGLTQAFTIRITTVHTSGNTLPWDAGADLISHSLHVAILDTTVTAIDDARICQGNDPITVWPLGNDRSGYQDGGPPLFIDSVMQPEHGTAAIVPDPQGHPTKVLYTPDPTSDCGGPNGYDSFSYTATNGYQDDSATAEVIAEPVGVKQILATKGYTGGDGPQNPTLDKTNAQMTITEGDTVTFKAIPEDGGQFAAGQPTWTVTGQAGCTGDTCTVTFNTYRAPNRIIVSVRTPGATAAKTVAITIVPYPTGIRSTKILGPPEVASVQNFLTGAYGTSFLQRLIASAGARGDDLFDADIAGRLQIMEHVTVVAGPPFTDLGIPAGELVDGAVEKPAPISNGGYIVDLNTLPTWALGFTTITDEGVKLHEAQDFLWKSNAADSLNTGWHEFATDLPIKYTLARFGNGQTVTTSNNGVAFTQPTSFTTPSAVLMLLAGSPAEIPAGGTTTVVLEGTVMLTAADIAAGSKTFTLTLYDDDAGWSYPDPLESVSVTVPTANGVAGMYTPFIATAILRNQGGKVGGSLGNSGTATAEVYYTTPDGTKSNLLNLKAL